MDILIISTRTAHQAKYWQKRLKQMQGIISKNDSYIICIDEDWEGGAGNGLGTLYAYKKAEKLAKQNDDIDLRALQQKGRSVAIFHTGGEGKRLWPLTASEYGNKSAVKIPSLIPENNPNQPLSILETVILQSNAYAPYRKGRLSVFWGDQLFLPSKPFTTKFDSPIDIFAKLGTSITEEAWEAKGLSKYGFITVDKQGGSQLIDKCDFATLQQLIDNEKISVEGGAGISLGSFSLSSQMTFALLEEFSNELEEKKDLMDTDPHFWMPMTLNEESYVSLMEKKGFSSAYAKQHSRRMQSFKQNFEQQNSFKQFFTAVDVGENCHWWDFGNVDSYFENIMKLAEDDEESIAMRKFFRLENAQSQTKNKDLEIDSQSILIDCNIQRGKIENSILVGVHADSVEISDSVLINCTAKTIKVDQNLLYDAIEEEVIQHETKTVRADLILPDTKDHIKLFSTLGRNGKEDWKTRLSKNKFTYEQLQKILETLDIMQAEALSKNAREHAVRSLDFSGL